MLIDCPACARSYHVSPAEIEGGRTVICPRCDARWFVDDPAGAGARHAGAARFDAAERPVPVAETWAQAPARRRRPRVPVGMTLGLASVALVSLTLGARATIVQMMPRAAALYAAAGLPVNLRGLEFREVRTARADPSSPEVTIKGDIRNVAGRRVRVPRLVFEVRDEAGQPLIRWSERAPAKLVGAGRTLAFASSPHAIPPESHVVLVHFEDADAS